MTQTPVDGTAGWVKHCTKHTYAAQKKVQIKHQ